jgi:hypothetical protein
MSRYSAVGDWLRAGRSRDRSVSPGRGEISLFSTSSRQVLGPIRPPIQCLAGAITPMVKQPGREVDH